MTYLSKRLQKLLKKFVIGLIKVYQVFLSPDYGNQCRFYPSCSKYAEEAFNSYNLISATKLTFLRIARCRPFGAFGYDPVPEEKHHV